MTFTANEIHEIINERDKLRKKAAELEGALKVIAAGKCNYYHADFAQAALDGKEDWNRPPLPLGEPMIQTGGPVNQPSWPEFKCRYCGKVHADYGAYTVCCAVPALKRGVE